MGDIWPQWRYHQDFPEGRIFVKPEDVPDGWTTGPHMIRREPIVKPTPLPTYDEDEAEDPMSDQMSADAAPDRRPPVRPRKQRV